MYFLFSTSSRPVLRPNQPSFQWVPGASPGGKVAGGWSWSPPPTSAEAKRSMHPFPHTSSWSSAYWVKHRNNLTYYYPTLYAYSLDYRVAELSENNFYQRALPKRFMQFIFVQPCNSVGIAMNYKLGGRGSISDTGKKLFCTPQCPDWLWFPPKLVYEEFQGLFPRG
jgi:hypothetical protein